MAKKISRNSRAARHAGASDPEAKTLAELPRSEKTDLSNILIRTTAKNEALLEAKIHKKGRKKAEKKKFNELALDRLGNLDKIRVEKALNFSSRLDGKIAKSTSRAKYVQSVRKAGWDTTNELIKRELASVEDEHESKKPKEDLDPTASAEAEMETETPEDELVESAPDIKKHTNMFEILPEEADN